MNIRINLGHAPLDGETISFKAPCNASDVTGLIIYYPNGSGQEASREFTLNDANGKDIGMIDSIFAEGAIVKVVVDTDTDSAFVQNPDTNAYLERRLARTYVPHTMLASGWVGNTYSFESEYPNSKCDISIEVSATATSDEFEAFGASMICGSAESNTATALSDVPTVDIPIIIKVVTK